MDEAGGPGPGPGPDEGTAEGKGRVGGKGGGEGPAVHRPRGKRTVSAAASGRGPAPKAAAAAGGSGWSAMVFCTRKSTCLALHQLVRVLPALRLLLRPGVLVGTSGLEAGAAVIRADLQKQDGVRRAFGAGELDLLFITAVGAEGLDFRHCSLVVALDPPANVTQLLQLGGRARAQGARYLLVVATQEHDQVVRKLLREEEELVRAAKNIAVPNTKKLLDEEDDELEEAGWPAGASHTYVPHPSARAALAGARPADAVPAAGGGSRDGGNGGGGGQVLVEMRDGALLVPSTGARLPPSWAVPVLSAICHHLPATTDAPCCSRASAAARRACPGRGGASSLCVPSTCPRTS